MKLLIGIPVLKNVEITKNCIYSCINKGADILVIDNGSDTAMKDFLRRNSRNFKIIRNEKNIYVNPAWNQIIEYFLTQAIHTHLLILNNDIILNKKYIEVLENIYSLSDQIIPVSNSINDITKVNQDVNVNSFSLSVLTGGIAGTNIHLSRTQAALIYPIPEKLKVWFGDNWIYDNLRKLNYKCLLATNLISYHYGSQSVGSTPGISEIIEQDKKEWKFLN